MDELKKTKSYYFGDDDGKPHQAVRQLLKVDDAFLDRAGVGQHHADLRK